VFDILIVVVAVCQECRIADCGELAEGEDDGCIVDDGTGDKYAEFPSECDIDFENVSSYG